MAEGGIFGRIDAGYTSIEAQKSTGSLHAHSQLFVQCLHQHIGLAELMESLTKSKCKNLVQAYLHYKSHVCREVYAGKPEEQEDILRRVEESWPEYVHEAVLSTTPSYLRDICMSGKKWLKTYLQRDVKLLQERRQHHVHIYNE